VVNWTALVLCCNVPQNRGQVATPLGGNL
jgi:hypothetical protein